MADRSTHGGQRPTGLLMEEHWPTGLLMEEQWPTGYSWRDGGGQVYS
jgi:hypothetical protein